MSEWEGKIQPINAIKEQRMRVFEFQGHRIYQIDKRIIMFPSEKYVCYD